MNIFTTLIRERRHRDTAIALRQFGDYMLADIGLCRGDLAQLSGLHARPTPRRHD